MGFSLWNLLKASLLFTNSVLILNRRRFLAKYGLDDLNSVLPSDHRLKLQAIGFLHAIQYLKVPIIALNSVAILFELLLGGT
mmetsp:Transcript_13192/g.18912  ORF Transcript_13192/g.18912 Transcript_13192/m.18912 type:complete len:82 (+) Transcript_13192:42-287(+)